MLKSCSDALYDLPVPNNISYFWNFGSLLGGCLGIQIFTGLFLALHYTPEIDKAFYSVIMIMREVPGGWLLRSFHANGASMFFFCIFIHMGRGLYYQSFSLRGVWNSGIHMFLLLMAIAFTGYVLPWGQMSYWAATVITNLFSAFPVVGSVIMEYIWGGMSVSDPTLKRFFVFHFLGPFGLGGLFLVHMACLHKTGSSNPLGVSSGGSCSPFSPYFTSKDLLGFLLMIFFLCVVVFFSPDFFSDPENFIPADSMKTPAHIQPEWYFLFAYSILRGIPDKLGGVVLLLLSVLVLYTLPFFPKTKLKGAQFNLFSQFFFWMFVFNFFLLSLMATKAVEYPFIEVTWFSTVFYFTFLLSYVFFSSKWEEYFLLRWF
uniref:cytochrome b n=1 Tax=Xylophaga dorsalis TaxID=1526741 RepID=UPI002027C273|nr:cytochrome b [Xylophaga dorsalis]UPX88889.1 cytochrome b [Xylophaga dorsalis]